MFDNYFILKRLSKELENELKDFKFFKSVSQSKNEFVTGFFTKNTEKFLVFTFQKLPPLIYLRENFSFAKKNYAEFFNLLEHADLKSITIDDYERNIRFKFQNYELIFLIRGNHSNVVIIDDQNLIIDCYKKKDECLHKNFNQIFPASEIDLSFFNDESKFNSLFEN
ncbi:MAG: NFACT family protein, partial [Ignavibacteria bacterium]